jgi:hypothetical protein
MPPFVFFFPTLIATIEGEGGMGCPSLVFFFTTLTVIGGREEVCDGPYVFIFCSTG